MNTNRIPLTDVPEQAKYIEIEALSAFQSAIESGRFIGGQAVKEFEQTLCEWYNVKHAIACDSGSAALIAVMYGCKIMDGALFATPSMTFISVAEAARFLNAEPVYYDIGVGNWLMMQFDNGATMPCLEAAIPVALYGKHITAGAYDFETLIVDAAQAHGQSYHDDFTAMTLSFYPGKVIGAFGDGGAVLTNDIEIATCVRAFVNHGRLKGAKYIHNEYGFNFRMDALQASILKEKYKYLRVWLSGRQQVAQWYLDAMWPSLCHDCMLPDILDVDQHSWHLFVIGLDPSTDREQLRAYMSDAGIETGVHYPVPIHRQPLYSVDNINLSATDWLAANGMSLPIYPEMTQNEVSRVVETLTKGIEKCKKTE